MKSHWTICLILILLTNLFFFGSAYLYNKYYFSSWYGQWFVYVAIAITCWVAAKMHPFRKLVHMICTFCIGVITGYIFIIAATITPGSKDHNYVMYRVCIPALDRHYQAKGRIFSLNDTGWKEHVKCEYNVWNNREPLEGIE